MSYTSEYPDYDLEAGLDDLGEHMKYIADFENLLDSYYDEQFSGPGDQSPLEQALNHMFEKDHPLKSRFNELRDDLNGTIAAAVEKFKTDLKKIMEA